MNVCLIMAGDEEGGLENPEETQRVFMPCFEWTRTHLVLSRVIGQINGLYPELMEQRQG
jgi:hypothetical protein